MDKEKIHKIKYEYHKSWMLFFAGLTFTAWISYNFSGNSYVALFGGISSIIYFIFTYYMWKNYKELIKIYNK